MSLPVAPNTTCDIYHIGTPGPPMSPSIAGVPCFLKGDWRGGQEAGDRANSNADTWTHVMLVDASVDIRDGYTGLQNQMMQDNIYIPDKTGTRFIVIFVERVQHGTPLEHKRVFLDRQTPGWPTSEI